MKVPTPAVHVTGVSPNGTPLTRFTVPYGIPVVVSNAAIVENQRYHPAIPKVHYFESPLFQKSIVQICATVQTFGLKLGLGVGLKLGLGSALGLGLGSMRIVDFLNSGPSEL